MRIALLAMLMLTGCVQRSQTGDEQNAVARHCQARGLNVVLGYRGLLWHDLEYAKCVNPPEGVTPAEFLKDR